MAGRKSKRLKSSHQATPTKQKVKKSRPISTLGSHDNCKLHEAFDDRVTRCKAKDLLTGERCDRKPWQKFKGSTAPMCYKHRDQQVIQENCRAIAQCGRLCNRPMDPDETLRHFCPDHAASKDNYPRVFDKLPTELRFAIFEYLVPGPGRAIWLKGRPKHLFQDLYALLQVSKQVAEDCRAIFFRKAPVVIQITQDYVFFLGRRYNLNPGACNSQTVINSIPGYRLGRFRRIDIIIDVQCLESLKDDELFQRLQGLRAVILKTDGASNGDVPQIKVNLSITSVNSTTGAIMTADAVNGSFAVLKSMVCLCNHAGLYVDYSLVMKTSPRQDRSRNYMTEPRIQCTARSAAFFGKISTSIKEIVEVQLQGLRLLLWLKPHQSFQDETLKLWRLYLKYAAMNNALTINARNTHLAAMGARLYTARMALEARDTGFLHTLISKLRAKWQGFHKQDKKPIQVLDELFVVEPDMYVEAPSLQGVKTLPRFKWPAMPQLLYPKAAETRKIGGVLQYEKTKGKTRYRLITPELVSEFFVAISAKGFRLTVPLVVVAASKETSVDKPMMSRLSPRSDGTFAQRCNLVHFSWGKYLREKYTHSVDWKGRIN